MYSFSHVLHFVKIIMNGFFFTFHAWCADSSPAVVRWAILSRWAHCTQCTCTRVIRKVRIPTKKEKSDFSHFWHTPGLYFQMKGNRHAMIVQRHTCLLYSVEEGHLHLSVSYGKNRDSRGDQVLKAMANLQIPTYFYENSGDGLGKNWAPSTEVS
jgi:hypothetical protein